MHGVLPPFPLQHAFMMCRRKTLLLPALISMAKVKNKGKGPGFVHGYVSPISHSSLSHTSQGISSYKSDKKPSSTAVTNKAMFYIDKL
jgi:hypothetical protein